MVDLAHHVLERPLERALDGHLVVERLHDRQQIAIEHDVGAARCLDGAHG
jgi:hypothetical protein